MLVDVCMYVCRFGGRMGRKVFSFFFSFLLLIDFCFFTYFA